MTTTRLEAFSDAVIAILITIMVLELRAPHGSHWEALRPLFPVIAAYVLSFVHLGIYWNNHHHLLATCDRVSGAILWSNLHLLFWLSLIPFTTSWMRESGFAPTPTAAYGVVLLLSAMSWLILQRAIIRAHGPSSKLREAIGSDLKGKASFALYLAGVALSFVNRWTGVTLYAVVAVIWLIPDRRLAAAVDSAT